MDTLIPLLSITAMLYLEIHSRQNHTIISIISKHPSITNHINDYDKITKHDNHFLRIYKPYNQVKIHSIMLKWSWIYFDIKRYLDLNYKLILKKNSFRLFFLINRADATIEQNFFYGNIFKFQIIQKRYLINCIFSLQSGPDQVYIWIYEKRIIIDVLMFPCLHESCVSALSLIYFFKRKRIGICESGSINIVGTDTQKA